MRTSLKPIQSPLLDLILQTRTSTARKGPGNFRPEQRPLSTICLRCQFRGGPFKHFEGTKPLTTGSSLNWANSQKWFSDSPRQLPDPEQLEPTPRKGEKPPQDDLAPQAEKSPSAPENDLNPIQDDNILPESEKSSSQDRPSTVQHEESCHHQK